MKIKHFVIFRCQDIAHPLAAAAVLFCQAKALRRIAVDFPRSLAGKRQVDQPHEGSHILGGITDKKADLVGEGCGVFESSAKFRQQGIAGQRGVVAGLFQQDADALMGQVVFQIVPVVTEEQQSTLPGLQNREA